MNGFSKYPILLRDNITIKVSNQGAFEITDLRTNQMDRAENSAEPILDFNLNASDSYVYIDKAADIMIFDLRKPKVPVWMSPALQKVRQMLSKFIDFNTC